MFCDCLYYPPTFTLYSDNNPLNYILSTAKLSATISRWVTELADFHFTINYRPERQNSDADVTRCGDTDERCSEELPPDAIAATIKAIEVKCNCGI